MDIIQNDECPIVLGSRHLPESIIHKNLVWYRRLVGFLFRSLFKLFFPSVWEFSDTQCGLKIYNGNIARELYRNGIIDGFLFDIEIIMLAR